MVEVEHPPLSLDMLPEIFILLGKKSQQELL